MFDGLKEKKDKISLNGLNSGFCTLKLKFKNTDVIKIFIKE